MENLLEKSGLNWTIVRPVILTNSRKTGIYSTVNLNIQGFPKISRADVADLMIKSIDDKNYYNKKVLVSY